MLDILIVLLIMFPVGYFIVLMVSGGLGHRWWSIALQIIVGLLVAALFMGMLTLEAYNDEEKYNSGICEVCGGEFKFSGSSGRSTARRYYYTCEDCDHTISVNSIMN